MSDPVIGHERTYGEPWKARRVLPDQGVTATGGPPSESRYDTLVSEIRELAEKWRTEAMSLTRSHAEARALDRAAAELLSLVDR